MERLRKLMEENNENQYYNMKERFMFKGHEYESELNFAYLNGRLDEIFAKYNLDYDESYIMLQPLNAKNVENYINRVVRELLFNKGVQKDTADNVVYDIVNLLDEITFLLDRGSKTSLDMSLISIAQADLENPAIGEFMDRQSFNEDMTADEIFDVRLKEIEEMKKLNIPGVSEMLRAGEGVKPNQMYNIFKSLTFRTRVSNVEEIYPVLVKESWLDGLSSLDTLFIESNIARKSMIMNKKYMGESGVHNRNSSILAQNIRITEKDCGSKHYKTYFVKDAKMLKALEFKYRLDETTGSLVPIIPETDTHLIGTEVKVRSVLKCATKNGGICETCFGAHASWNLSTKDYTMDVGIEFAKDINAPISQLVLSFKHNASPFLKNSQITITSLSTGEIMDNKDFMDRKFNKLLFFKDYQLYFKEEDMTKNNKGEFKYFDKEFGDDDIIRVNKLYIKNNKTGEEYTLEDLNEVPLKVKGEQFRRFRPVMGETYYLNMEKDTVMHIMVNGHSTMKYKQISDLYNIDTDPTSTYAKRHFNNTGMDDIDFFMDKVLESDFYGENITSLEVIFRNKIVDPYSYKSSGIPDWSSDNPTYCIFSMKKVINRHRSLTTRVPALKLEAVINDPFYHDPRNLEPSAYDMLYENKNDVFTRGEDEE